MRDADGAIEFWVGTATDIHDRKLIEEQRTFIVAAGDALSRSLDYRETLAPGRGARRAATSPTGAPCTSSRPTARSPRSRSRTAIPAKVTFARELQERYPADRRRADRRRLP